MRWSRSAFQHPLARSPVGTCLVLAFGLLMTGLASAQRNVLLIVADDLGVDRVGAYAEHPVPGRTPVLDDLARRGLLFRNVWSDPVCSPSRATLLTGRYGFRTGVGFALNYDLDAWELPLAEVTLAELLAPTHRTAAVGKWHLAAESLGGLQHPLLQGFEHHHGPIAGLFEPFGNDYFDFLENLDGIEGHSTVYNTTDCVDAAIGLIDSFGVEPWFVYLAFVAPHAPFHKPPDELHTFNLPAVVETHIPIHVKAAVEAMDTEIGRLLSSLDPAVLANTVVVFVGDNGTDGLATTAPFLPSHAKGTLYEGGINVPLIITGPGVPPGGECKALVNTTDLFSTIAEIAGAEPVTGTDSVSLLPYFDQPTLSSLRSWAYAEKAAPVGFLPMTQRQRAIRDDRYKLVWVYDDGQTLDEELFFDLEDDPFEQSNLLGGLLTVDQRQTYEALAATMTGLYEPWVDMGCALAGSNGEPRLIGLGVQEPAAQVQLLLDHALAGAPAFLLISPAYLGYACQGGLLVPSADLVLPCVTGPAGTLALVGAWPPALPPGWLVYYQFWVVDPAGPFGFSASNAVRSQTPPS